MSVDEWYAIIELLNRTPMTRSEKLWINNVVNREINVILEAEKQKKEGDNG